MFIIWWIIVGLIAGWITGKIMKGSGYGALMDIVIGIMGPSSAASLCARWALPATAA